MVSISNSLFYPGRIPNRKKKDLIEIQLFSDFIVFIGHFEQLLSLAFFSHLHYVPVIVPYTAAVRPPSRFYFFQIFNHKKEQWIRNLDQMLLQVKHNRNGFVFIFFFQRKYHSCEKKILKKKVNIFQIHFYLFICLLLWKTRNETHWIGTVKAVFDIKYANVQWVGDY